MMRCLRISRAYSWRTMVRYSTALYFASFIGIMTFIFHLYAFKREHKPHYKAHIGDFDYRPGIFLKGRQPNENISYCKFNYGLPKTLIWRKVREYKSPELTHYVIYNAIIGTAYANHSKYDALTYATQATPEFIYHVVEIAKYWDGPISLAVFVPDYDLYVTMQIMNQLCHCYSAMSKVSLHLFYPTKIPPKIPYHTETRATLSPTTTPSRSSVIQTLQEKINKYKNLNKTTRAEYIQWVRRVKIERMTINRNKVLKPVSTLRFIDCAGWSNAVVTYRRQHDLMYPINVGRNVARNASKTNYFIVSDIEMVPSEGLATKFLSMVNDLMGRKKREEGCVFSKTIFVVPLFEVVRGEPIPRDKQTLSAMVAVKRATYFHAKTCPHCQRFPGLQTWLTRRSSDNIEPMMIAHREFPYHRWEPLYIGTQKEPWYNEMLVWEGLQDKMTQMLELCLQDYRLIILDGGFLCHSATPIRRRRNAVAMKNNNQWYRRVLAGLKIKYPDKPACRLFWGIFPGKRKKKQTTGTENKKMVNATNTPAGTARHEGTAQIAHSRG
ncbi:beta-1,4-glucuronyltransferase 1-like [Plodia interpunctella]|uniref:beta-1,4-glucuronyltransferase 1-like n=1 Tax=Plodia interpunctella TaxID=58824 RepID=UPI0023684D5B|nr:beta-1,4-glucuronyltransferase 1-like [Plodia interpunctella]XP_053616544.1 beta-1,4-glucuronyltransferase 1-like [Plodia interpunctella]